MKYYIIAGEASGDLHGSNLVKNLRIEDSDAEIRAWGGELMEAQGADVVKHYRDLAFMGFSEVLMNIRTILKNFDLCKKSILEFDPDVLILIDYPGFNLRMAKFAHQKGIKVFYYISPQIWAWKQNRVKQIRAYVDQMYVILPFEKEIYAKFDVEVEFVGHPLIDAVEQFKTRIESRSEFLSRHGIDDKPYVLLMPGSRKQEIATMLPVMLRAASKIPDFQYIIAGAPSQDMAFYEKFLEHSGVRVLSGETYPLLTFANAAMVTSGTATLETAIFGVPQVVCYKGGFISYLIARSLVKIKYISLVNLIMDREVVTELIQRDLSVKKLMKEFKQIAFESERQTALLNDYKELHALLGGGGASALTAKLMLKTLRNTD
ncbi:MAG TPA: lipid-A-disaccharide synthase [Cryomorphaceae bacterium]|nr:lipid-A-disaccharide synthase [Cryomorphaceae bacterium]